MSSLEHTVISRHKNMHDYPQKLLSLVQRKKQTEKLFNGIILSFYFCIKIACTTAFIFILALTHVISKKNSFVVRNSIAVITHEPTVQVSTSQHSFLMGCRWNTMQ